MVMAAKARAFERATNDPIASQKKVLLEYLARNKDTEYGHKFNFSAIRSIADYQAAVPMCDSEDIFGYVERMKAGEANVLTSDKTIFFATTSGTTDKPKFIPVTRFSRGRKAAVADLWTYYIAKDHPDILNGKILALISPEKEGITDMGVLYGAETGHAYKNLPWIVRARYALPYAVFEIKDYESRYYCILRISMAQNITTIAALNPSTVALLCQKIPKWQEDIISDIRTGTLSGSFDIEHDARRAIEKTLKADPGRADGLRNILDRNGELLPKDFWPGLKLIECWKGGTVRLYLKELPQYFGDVPIRDFGCLSSEARSSIPISDTGAGGVLAINTNFYEFLPVEDAGKKKKRFLLCDQVEKGRNYFLIVTTPGGLYRYNIDDIVTIDGVFNKTPLIEFVQKGLSAVSITGEKLYEAHVNEAVNKAVEKTKTILEFFSATAQPGNPSRYVFLVEFEREEAAEKKRALLRTIEEELYRQNEEYRHIREAQLLGAPILKVVAKGEFERYRALRISQGSHDGQFKVPELVADPDFQKNFKVTEEIPLD